MHAAIAVSQSQTPSPRPNGNNSEISTGEQGKCYKMNYLYEQTNLAPCKCGRENIHYMSNLLVT